MKDLQERIDLHRKRMRGLVGADEDDKELSDYSIKLGMLISNIAYLTDKENR